MTEPTENERAELNERLARAMGEWPVTAKWNCGLSDCSICEQKNAAIEPPDFTRDLEASRELVLWLAGQRRDGGLGAERWRKFCKVILPDTRYLPTVFDIAAEALTADPLLIARAACEAIGGRNATPTT